MTFVPLVTGTGEGHITGGETWLNPQWAVRGWSRNVVSYDATISLQRSGLLTCIMYVYIHIYIYIYGKCLGSARTRNDDGRRIIIIINQTLIGDLQCM